MMTNNTLARPQVPEQISLGCAAGEAVQASGILGHRYFADLTSGKMSKADFIKSQKQFYFAVAFYARPMALLLSRTDNVRKRLELLHNIVDEHGGLNLGRCHESTFKQFLRSLDSGLDFDMEASPAVLAFNRALTATCTFESIEESIACLAIIELAFADISTMIGDGVIERGFVQAQHLVHYSVHKHLDRKHADDFFAIIEEDWQDVEKSKSIERGMALGLHIFGRLYDGIF